MRLPLGATMVLLYGCGTGHNTEADATDILLTMHQQVMEAHRQGTVAPWLDLEADDYVFANAGTISFPTKAERRAARQPYLASTSFAVYRDLREPVVRISTAGAMGWLIAEVEIEGTQITETGDEIPVEAVWAWIELYQKQQGDWKLVGNVSNRRP